MIVASKLERLPDLGQVWGDAQSYEPFKEAVQAHCPGHWQDLCAWFQGSTHDRGFIIEIPQGEQLQAILQGAPLLLSLTIIYGNPQAIEAQVQYGPERFLHGGWLLQLTDTLELSTHT